MRSLRRHAEHHRTDRIGWLRAAVLGANDGIVSTAGLILGVAGASADPRTWLTAGIAGLAAGALSMAAGEYVSVSTQRDTGVHTVQVDGQGGNACAADIAADAGEVMNFHIVGVLGRHEVQVRIGSVQSPGGSISYRRCSTAAGSY